MGEGAVVLIEPLVERRRELAQALSALGIEAVPAATVAEGVRFARGLAPDLVAVAQGQLEEEGADAVGWRGLSPEPYGPEEEPAPLARRLALAVAARQLGLQWEPDSESAAGSFDRLPPLELLRVLHARGGTVRIEAEAGRIDLERGEVIASSAGAARGVKALCRWSRLARGAFHLRAALEPDERNLAQSFELLVFAALEDLIHGAPEPRTRLRIDRGPRFFAATFTPAQQLLLARVAACATVGELLDASAESDGAILRDLLGLVQLGAVELEDPSQQVAVVTDSWADLPLELARSHGIEVLPASVVVGHRLYLDGVNLSGEELYRLVEKGAQEVHSAPPQRAEFARVFANLAPRKDIVSVHVSENLSRSLSIARQAAEEHGAELQGLRGGASRVHLRLVDSRSVSAGLGMLTLFAARLARRGFEAGAIGDRLEGMRDRIQLLFTVADLEPFIRDGRIGRGAALEGSLSGLHPILSLVAGEMEVVERVQGEGAVLPRLAERFRESLPPGATVAVAVFHAGAASAGEGLRRYLEAAFRVRESWVARMGPKVASHFGFGTVGAAVCPLEPDEMELLAPLV